MSQDLIFGKLFAKISFWNQSYAFSHDPNSSAERWSLRHLENAVTGCVITATRQQSIFTKPTFLSQQKISTKKISVWAQSKGIYVQVEHSTFAKAEHTAREESKAEYMSIFCKCIGTKGLMSEHSRHACRSPDMPPVGMTETNQPQWVVPLRFWVASLSATPHQASVWTSLLGWGLYRWTQSGASDWPLVLSEKMHKESVQKPPRDSRAKHDMWQFCYREAVCNSILPLENP